MNHLGISLNTTFTPTQSAPTPLLGLVGPHTMAGDFNWQDWLVLDSTTVDEVLPLDDGWLSQAARVALSVLPSVAVRAIWIPDYAEQIAVGDVYTPLLIPAEANLSDPRFNIYRLGDSAVFELLQGNSYTVLFSSTTPKSGTTATLATGDTLDVVLDPNDRFVYTFNSNTYSQSPIVSSDAFSVVDNGDGSYTLTAISDFDVLGVFTIVAEQSFPATSIADTIDLSGLSGLDTYAFVSVGTITGTVTGNLPSASDYNLVLFELEARAKKLWIQSWVLPGNVDDQPYLPSLLKDFCEPRQRMGYLSLNNPSVRTRSSFVTHVYNASSYLPADPSLDSVAAATRGVFLLNNTPDQSLHKTTIPSARGIPEPTPYSPFSTSPAHALLDDGIIVPTVYEQNTVFIGTSTSLKISGVDNVDTSFVSSQVVSLVMESLRNIVKAQIGKPFIGSAVPLSNELTDALDTFVSDELISQDYSVEIHLPDVYITFVPARSINHFTANLTIS